MRPWYSIGPSFLAILAFGAVGLLLCAGLLPPLDQGRTEARSVYAYHQTLKLSKTVAATDTEVVLSEVDPFGQPFRVIPLPDGRARVLSSGPNGTTPDADDITSDMPESPGHPYARKRNRQFLIAFGAGGFFWLACCVLWFRSRPSDDDEG